MINIFKALSEESRLRIVSLLLDEELCVCEIEEILKMTQSNASRHLTALKRCGILESYKKAQWAYYCINPEFKEKNQLLWEHLEVNLKKLSTYEMDKKAFRKFRSTNPCSCNRESEE